MIDTEELRRLAQAATHPTTKGRWMRLFGERTVYDRMEDGCRGVPIVAADHHPPGPQAAAYLDFIAAANPAAISELLDRLEAAEKEIALKERVIDALGSELNAVANERDALRAENAALVDDMNLLRDNSAALRAKIAEMERQEPVAWMLNCQTLGGDTGWILSWTQSGAGLCDRLPGTENEKKLYALPGAQAQPAPSVCTWVEDEGVWHSDCGGAVWQFTDEGPAENGMKFCLACGRPLEVLAPEAKPCP